MVDLPDERDSERGSCSSTDFVPLSPITSQDNNDGHIEAETTVTPALMRIGIVAGLGSLLFGYDTGVVSGALLVIGTDLGGKALSRGQESFLVSSALFGACAGSLTAGKGADRFGRKPVILAAAVLFTLGALEQAAAQVYKEVILGRVLVGIGVGLASSVLPMYLAEVSPAKYRGRIVASLVVLITAGQVLSYIVDAIFFNFASGWRWMFGCGAVPAIAQLILSFQLPESPRWLILHDRIAPARKTLRAVYPKSSGDAIQRRIERIQVEVTEEDSSPILGLGGVSDLRKAKDSLVHKMWSQQRARRATILACGLQAFQAITGFNTLMYFSSRILQAAHFGQPAAFSLVVAVSNFVCTVIALRLIDRLGRRPLLLRTLVGMFFGMLLLGMSFFFIPAFETTDDVATLAPSYPNAWAFVALFGMAIFCSSYALGLGNVPWVLQSETFAQDVRATAASLATATNWIANLIVASTFLHLAHGISIGGVFLSFAVIIILAFLFTYRYLPETKGLGLEETQALFDGDVWDASRQVDSRHGISESSAAYAPICAAAPETNNAEVR